MVTAVVPNLRPQNRGEVGNVMVALHLATMDSDATSPFLVCRRRVLTAQWHIMTHKVAICVWAYIKGVVSYAKCVYVMIQRTKFWTLTSETAVCFPSPTDRQSLFLFIVTTIFP